MMRTYVTDDNACQAPLLQVSPVARSQFVTMEGERHRT
jgi:hypothetical protein